MFVGGAFDTVGCNSNSPQACRNIAKWDGQNWDALEGGVNGDVLDILVDGNKVYVVGDFDTAGTISAKRIAIWDDSARTWSSFGNCGPVIHSIYDRVEYVEKVGNDFYFAGEFDSVNTGSTVIRCNNIVRWNGTSWDTLGEGLKGSIHNIAGYRKELYVVGDFEKKFGDSLISRNIAKWDGTSWKILGSGTDYDIKAIAFRGDSVIIGGFF